MTYLCGALALASSICWLMSQLASIMFFLLHLLIITLTFCPSEPPLVMLYFVQHDRLLIRTRFYCGAGWKILNVNNITVFPHKKTPHDTFNWKIWFVNIYSTYFQKLVLIYCPLNILKPKFWTIFLGYFAFSCIILLCVFSTRECIKKYILFCWFSCFQICWRITCSSGGWDNFFKTSGSYSHPKTS